MSSQKGATFLRRAGTSSQHGIDFQYKVAALLWARGTASGCGARLGAEHAAAGAFDDVSVRVTLPDGRRALLLIQLKHKDSDEAKIDPQAMAGDKGPFSARKYFRSYLDDVDYSRLGATPEETYFVMFTNATLPTHRGDPASGAVEHFLLQLIDTGCTPEQIITLKKDYLPDDNDGAVFLKRFVWCGRQASDEDLTEILRQQVCAVLRRCCADVDARTRLLLTAVEEWWQEVGDVQYLTSDWAAWKSICQDDPPLFASLDFKDEEIGRVLSEILRLQAGCVLAITSDIEDMELRGSKMATAASLLRLLVARSDDCPGVTSSLRLWERGWSRELALVLAPGGAEFVQSLGLKIVNALNAGRALLLLMGPGGIDRYPLAAWLHNGLGSDRWVEMEDSFSFNNLSTAAKDAILEHPVNFQGRPTTLGALGQEHVLEWHLRGETFAQLLRMRGPLHVGGPPAPAPPLYIRRRLQCLLPVKPGVLAAAPQGDTYIVKGATKDEVQRLVPPGEKVQLLDRHDSTPRFVACRKMSWAKFREFRAENNGRPIHLLKVVDGELTWRQSAGPTESLEPFLPGDKGDDTRRDAVELVRSSGTCAPFEDELADSDVRTVLLSGEPGAGKSGVLARVAESLVEVRPEDWVLRVALAEHTDALDAGDAFALLRRCCASNSEEGDAGSVLAEALLRDRLVNSGRVHVLVDGFDEISPDFTDSVVALLQELQESCATTLWVASRQHMQERLEAELKTTAFHLKPLTVDDQRKFWVQYWKTKKRTNGMSEDVLEARAVYLLKKLGGKLRLQFRLNLPLHTMILAETFGETFLSNADTMSHIDRVSMFQDFVKVKFNLYCSEKAKLDVSHILMKKIVDDLYGKFMERHKLCALLTTGIFELLDPVMQSEMWKTINDFLKEVQEGSEKTGIIVGVSCGKPWFLHRTFAEYFAGLWIAENQNKVDNILSYLLRKDFNWVRSVVDSIVSKGNILHEAVLNDDVGGLKKALGRSDVNIMSLDGGRRTALQLAAQNGTKNGLIMCEILLKKTGANMAESATTALYNAAKSQAWENVKLLFKYGAQLQRSLTDVPQIESLLKEATKRNLLTEKEAETVAFDVNWNVFSEGRAILHLAVICEDIECATMLLEKGAEVKSKDKQNNTPLHYAVRMGNEQMLDLLLAYEAPGHLRDVSGFTPLHIACTLGNTNIVWKLLSQTVTANTRSKTGATLLHSAANHPDIIRLLLESGYSADASDSKGNSALHEAARRKNENVVRLLVNKGADVNASNFQGLTPLHVAAVVDSAACARVLLRRKADASARTLRGETPLHIAVGKKSSDVARILLYAGAHADARNNRNETPMDVALRLGWREEMLSLFPPDASGVCLTCPLICDQATPPTPEPTAQQALMSGLMNLKLSIGKKKVASPLPSPMKENVFLSPAATALLTAVRRKQLPKVKTMLSRAGAEDLLLSGRDDRGDSALHVACRQWSPEAVAALAAAAPARRGESVCGAGGIVAARNNDGDTPAHAAATRKDTRVMQELLDRGADLAAANARGDTPLHLACRAAVYPMVRYLCPRVRAEVLAMQNAEGDTPLHLAMRLGPCKEEGQLQQLPPDERHRQLVITHELKDVASCWHVNGHQQEMHRRPSSRAQLARVVLAVTPRDSLNWRNARGDTPLHVAARGRRFPALAAPSASGESGVDAVSVWAREVIHELLHKGADPLVVSAGGDSALHLACRLGVVDLEMVRMLAGRLAQLGAGREVLTMRNAAGDMPLHEALTRPYQTDLVAALLTLGADAGAEGAGGETPLQKALRCGAADAAKWLSVATQAAAARGVAHLGINS